EWLFPGYYLVGMYSQLEVAGFILIYLILSSSLEFSRSWFSTIKAKTRIIELEAEKNASELKALRAQVNPHFLFNSLNTIYNEALKKTDKAPRLILKLSDMLRYVVDKMDHEKVTLEEEIEYLTHFVDLHKERLNNPEKVKFKMEGNFSDAKIAPLLLIIFIENCFKHGDLTDQDARIAISIKFENGELTLICENTMYENEKGSNKITGMGFQNARRRLELAYGGCHNLDISSEGNIFTTKLKMELD
ncbi:MAG: histidine kinase, partial [Gracilimonas sp.]